MGFFDKLRGKKSGGNDSVSGGNAFEKNKTKPLEQDVNEVAYSKEWLPNDMSTSRINTALKKIKEEEEQWGESAYSSYNDTTGQFAKWLSTHFDTTQFSVAEYETLSSVADGVNFNGLFIYSLNPEDKHNIYDENEDWWENEELKRYLFFADDSISWYCYNSNTNTFDVLDKPSGDKMDEHSSVGELLAVALETSLT
jgi:hypothetical protein